jgi:uncharacterized membrane protein
VARWGVWLIAIYAIQSAIQIGTGENIVGVTAMGFRPLLGPTRSDSLALLLVVVQVVVSAFVAVDMWRQDREERARLKR